MYLIKVDHRLSLAPLSLCFKAAGQNDIPFGRGTHVFPSNIVIDRGPLPWGRTGKTGYLPIFECTLNFSLGLRILSIVHWLVRESFSQFLDPFHISTAVVYNCSIGSPLSNRNFFQKCESLFMVLETSFVNKNVAWRIILWKTFLHLFFIHHHYRVNMFSSIMWIVLPVNTLMQIVW